MALSEEKANALTSEQDSVFARRVRLYEMILKGYLGPKLVVELLPDQEPILYERPLWDYKLEIPSIPISPGASESERADFDAQVAELTKDVVSFYNSYGGYIVVGIRDEPRAIEGFEKPFDSDELNRRLYALTKRSIDCHYKVIDCPYQGGTKRIGFLFVPQRPDSTDIAQFLRDAPKGKDGRQAYKRGQSFLRDADSCRPAESAEDYSFLCSQGRRRFAGHSDVGLSPVLSNNLGPRDPGFVRFVGRSEYLAELWRWLLDRYSPVKLLSGLGGVGKTAIAREFSEVILRSAPAGFEKIIWLSAKEQYYAAIRGTYIPATRVDFEDVDSLLRAILVELGTPDEKINAEWTRDELMEEVIVSLRVLPSFIVIDDLDALPSEGQQGAFHALIQVLSQTMHNATRSSRALVTARLELGASPAQLTRVKGLNDDEFADFVGIMATKLGVPLAMDKNNRLLSRFHRITDGSPTFAGSILRLMHLGESLDLALTKWQGSDGEEVRNFAFKRELDHLTDSQIRTLFAVCVLGESVSVELQLITQSSESLLRDDIAELRNYHLLTLEETLPAGSTKLVVPSNIRLMRDILRERVRDPKRIETECAKIRQESKKLSSDIGRYVQRVISLWIEERVDEALDLTIWLDKQNPEQPDIKCLLGRAYLRLKTPDAKRADLAFKRAFELRCRRQELVPLWIEAKIYLRDWMGIVDITKVAKEETLPVEILIQRSVAFKELAEQAARIGDLRVAADHCRNGGREIDEAFKRNQATGRVIELKELRNHFFYTYVRLVDRLTATDEEAIDVWLAVRDSFECYVRKESLIRLGIAKLRAWWEAVERRGKFEESTERLMKVELGKLFQMLETLKQQTYPDPSLIEFAQWHGNMLRNRLAEYSLTHGGTRP